VQFYQRGLQGASPRKEGEVGAAVRGGTQTAEFGGIRNGVYLIGTHKSIFYFLF